jgi:hypothetical protein
MFTQKFKAAIQKYLEAQTKPAKSGAKGAITKLVNAANEAELKSIPEILQEFSNLPDWLKLRFEKGSLYKEGDRVFGWYHNEQIQACELPLTIDIYRHDDGEDFLAVLYTKVTVTHEAMGFTPAIDLPFDGTLVNVPVSDDYPYLELWKCGWASPCEIQWSWFGRPRWSQLEGYVVERSIIPHGFWQAWKWWPEAWQWYMEKRPELFEDAVWWGKEPFRYSPPDDHYAAVLGNASKHFETFRLDD